MVRRMFVLVCAASLAAPPFVAVTAAAAPAAPGVVAAPAKESKKKDRKGRKGKKKEDRKTVAEVDAKWTVTTGDRSLGNGTESQTITVTIKNAEATFRNDSATSAQGRALIAVDYQAKYLNQDSAWWIGCETEQVTSTATWSRELGFVVYQTNRRTRDGQEQKLSNGWAVELEQPALRMVTTGFREAYESPLLMEDCRRTAVSEPLGGWSTGFAGSLSANGKLNNGGRGVLLTEPYTLSGHTGEVKGTIKFNESVEKRGGANSMPTLN